MQTVTRETLYEQVWTRPMTKVAADYGVTPARTVPDCVCH